MKRTLLAAVLLSSSTVLGCHAQSDAASPAADAPLPAPLAASADHIRALFAHFDEAGLAGAFSPEFIQAKGDDLRKIFGTIGPQLGACTKQEAVKVRSDTSGIVRIECANGIVKASIEARAAAPYLMDGLLVEAKPR